MLTDATLAEIEEWSRGISVAVVECAPPHTGMNASAAALGTRIVQERGRNLLDLCAEVRRLRSDEWLSRALKEADDHFAVLDAGERAEVLAILRKHRDGKA